MNLTRVGRYMCSLQACDRMLLAQHALVPRATVGIVKNLSETINNYVPYQILQDLTRSQNRQSFTVTCASVLVGFLMLCAYAQLGGGESVVEWKTMEALDVNLLMAFCCLS